MPKTYRIRTEIGKDKVLQVKLDQDYDKLELLSLAIYPDEVYTRTCADYGVVCGRVFSNRGLGIENARVSLFIPLQSEDESNPIISTLYPYRTFEQFNEDGYKYNLLPYTQSHSGHVPVGTFPERIDALINPSVIEVYDKYYKFTAKTNGSGDYMIFGVPIGQYDLFMQVDLSDIGEFSLTPQDLLRSGRATEAQLDGTRFKFSENYSELPQIVTINKTIQVSPFYGQKEICDYHITRADFDLTLEAFVEIQPTAVFMGSIFSTADTKKIKNNCKIPPKQGWLCELISGQGTIESLRQTVNLDSDNRPIIENFILERDGKVIDQNGAWLIEVPMNLDFVYTDEFGNRVISSDGTKGVPTKGKYRFKIKWNQSTFLSEENRRGYFLVPNVKEWGWEDSYTDPSEFNNLNPISFDLEFTNSSKIISNGYYLVFLKTENVESFKIMVSFDGGETFTEKVEWKTVIPFLEYNSNIDFQVKIEYVLVNSTEDGKIYYTPYDENKFKQLASYAFSMDWVEYGNQAMITEAVNCEDRFYNFQYNKVYTVASLLDRHTSKKGTFFVPQRTTQIKNITDNNCESEINRFPTNDAYYRYDVMFIIISAILSFLKFVFIPLVVILHILAFLWPVIITIIIIIRIIWEVVVFICELVAGIIQVISFGFLDFADKCPVWNIEYERENPFVNIKLPLILHTEDGCQACKCNLGSIDIDDNTLLDDLTVFIRQTNLRNISNLANLNSFGSFTGMTYFPPQIGSIAGGYCPNNNFLKGWDDLQFLAAGNAPSTTIPGANVVKFQRLPVFPKVDGDDNLTSYLGDQNPEQQKRYGVTWSSQITIAERLNLFNTKAKYYNNIGNGFSPGTVGWNQIKVRFFNDIVDNQPWDGTGVSYLLDSANGAYHHDNVIAILIDNSTGLTVGQLLTFQNPRTSQDPNVNTTQGTLTIPSYFDVTYAEPNHNIATSIISNRITRYFTRERAFDDFNTPTAVAEGKSCYPMDIEYFQVIRVQKLSTYKTKVAPLDTTGNNRFSLPWRFLDSSYVQQSKPADYDEVPNNEAGYFNNSMMYMRVFTAPYGTNGASITNYYNDTGMCVQNVNMPLVNGSVPKPDKLYTDTDHEIWQTYWDVWSHLSANSQTAICFLVRGVDPNSQKCEISYDLSRLYGYEKYLDEEGVDFSQSSKGLRVTGNFFLNIPIQGYNDDNGGQFTNNWSGLRLPQHPAFIDNNPDATNYGGKIFYKSYFYEYRQNTITTEEGEVIQGYQPNWTTNNHLYYSALDTFFYTYSWNLPGSYVGDVEQFNTWADSNTQPLSVREDRNYFARAWYRRTPTNNDRTSVPKRTFNCQVQADLNNFNGCACGISECNGSPPENMGFDINGNYPINLRTDSANLIFGCTNSMCSNPSGYYSKWDTFNGTQDVNFYSGCRPYLTFGDGFWWNGNYGGEGFKGPTLCTDPGTEGGTYLNKDYPGGVPHAYFDDTMDERNNWHPSLAILCNGIFDESRACMLETYPNPSAAPTRRPGACYWFIQDQHLNAAMMMSAVYHGNSSNRNMNHVGGYWGNEYVEGGSAMSLGITQQSPGAGRIESYRSGGDACLPDFNNWTAGYVYDWGSASGLYSFYNGSAWEIDYAGDARAAVFKRDIQNDPGGRSGEPFRGDITAWCPRNRYTYLENDRTYYLSPVYSKLAEIQNSQYTTGGDNWGAIQWYKNLNMSYRTGMVFRTDRLPSSNFPNSTPQDQSGTGYLLSQNNGFKLYVYTDTTSCRILSLGGGNAANNISEFEPDLTLYENQSSLGSDVIQSTIDCQKAIDLNSYSVSNNQAVILANNPPGAVSQSTGPSFGLFSRDGSYKWFERGEGCYNVVSRPLKSLKKISEYDANLQKIKQYSDIFTVVEWVQRTKLTLAACFDIFSHTFSNNWINGTLYAFPFQLTTTFDSNNLPTNRKFCKNLIYFNEVTKNLYYRSSPYDGNNFIGKKYDANENYYGNIKNLLYPTTIIDLGPKNQYIQELVNSDEYDGYVADKIPVTTYQNVETLLNILILSRLINSNFLDLLFPKPDDRGSSVSNGTEDPSVTSFFQNKRWMTDPSFSPVLFSIGGGNLPLPGLIDGDYAQLISINCEIGNLEFDANNYKNTDLFLNVGGVAELANYPWFGVVFSGDNQLRDYISPRRKIWSELGTISDINSMTTLIPGIYSQKVPFYKWNDIFNNSNSIFGHQNNNFITNSNTYFNSKYQELDRFSSPYFKGEDSFMKTKKGYIANYTVSVIGSDVGITPKSSISANEVTNNSNGILFGAPFQFYFGLKRGGTAMDLFIMKYVDTTRIND